jgi:glutamate-1-semialdehyde 2,1-aminomutase
MFDEVITAFRYSLGGAQEYYGVMPDITTMGKIVAGGMPGGAVAGRKDVMGIMAFSGDKKRDRFERAAHAGTFNCILPIAAAGITTMKIIERGEAIPYANRAGETLRQGMRDVLKRRGVPGAVVGECSTYNAFLGEEIARGIEERDVETIMGARGPTAMLMRKAMLLEGVDWMRTGGMISIMHGDAELEFTINAFDQAIKRVQAEGAI